LKVLLIEDEYVVIKLSILCTTGTHSVLSLLSTYCSQHLPIKVKKSIPATADMLLIWSPD